MELHPMPSLHYGAVQDNQQAETLTLLESAIQTQPEQVAAALESLERPIGNIDKDILALRSLVQLLLDKRYDKDLDFDDDTEDALLADHDHQALVKLSKTALGKQYHGRGRSGSVIGKRPDPTAEMKQRAVSVDRLRFFVKRVLSYSDEDKPLKAS